MAARHFIITGRVQGVGFRAFVRELARELGCTGEVWNCRNGNVEVVAVTNEITLQDFAEKLKRGPGRVDSVQIFITDDREYRDFSIGSTR